MQNYVYFAFLFEKGSKKFILCRLLDKIRILYTFRPKSLMSKHKIGWNSFKIHKKLETQSLWLKFWLFVFVAKTNPKLFLINILITCSLQNTVSRGQNDCLSFELKWQDVDKCLECWYFAQNLSWQYCIWIKLEWVDTSVCYRNSDVNGITHLHNQC